MAESNQAQGASGQHTPGRTIDEAAKRLVALRRLARLEQKELGGVTAQTRRKISEAVAGAEAVCVVDDARAAIAAATQGGAK